MNAIYVFYSSIGGFLFALCMLYIERKYLIDKTDNCKFDIFINDCLILATYILLVITPIVSVISLCKML